MTLDEFFKKISKFKFRLLKDGRIRTYDGYCPICSLFKTKDGTRWEKEGNYINNSISLGLLNKALHIVYASDKSRCYDKNLRRRLLKLCKN